MVTPTPTGSLRAVLPYLPPPDTIAPQTVADWAAIEEGLTQYDPSLIASQALHDEWHAMVTLYRGVRTLQAHLAIVGSPLPSPMTFTRIYYRLRSIQGSLAMAYSVAGSNAISPMTSPLGTAIGLYDAPKILAQETHLQSGTYDADLRGFAEWMREIATDLDVRRTDYVQFYGATETVDARQALERILGTTTLVASPLDCDRVTRDLEQAAHRPGGLVAAVRATEVASHVARMGLVRSFAHLTTAAGANPREPIASAAADLQPLLFWPLPVTSRQDLDPVAEQAALDDLLERLPLDPEVLRREAKAWETPVLAGLKRACVLVQSVRDFPRLSERRPGNPGVAHGYRWYVWELLNVAEQLHLGQSRLE